MMTSLLNPFKTDSAPGPDQFFGRKELLAAIDRFLENPHEKMMFVNGPRRMGKTSLLRKLRHELSQRGFVPVSIDLQGKAEEPLPQVLYEAMVTINVELNNKSRFSINDFEEDYRLFDRKFLPSITPTQEKIVLLFDEFDVPGDRAILQEEAATKESAYQKFIPYLQTLVEKPIALKFIFAIGRSLSDLSEYYEPIKTFAACEKLDEFGLSDTADLITSLTAGTIRFTDTAIEEIQKHTNGHPQFVQCLASCAFDYAGKQKLNEIDGTDMESPLLTAVEKYSGAISLTVEDVLPQERAYLILIAKLRERNQMATEKAIFHEMKQLGFDEGSSDIAGAVSGLLDAKILVFNRNFLTYSFAMPFLEKWFVHEYSTESVTVEINKTDKRFNDYIRLAKTRYKERNFTKAISLFRTIADKYPQSFEARYGLAVALDSEGKSSPEAVIAEFEKAYRLDPNRSRHTYKTFLKKAYEKETAHPFLEKLVEISDSAIEDRKKLLKSYFELWRPEIVTGRFDHFQSTIKNKPWLLKDYQPEIIQFIDDLLNEIVNINPSAANDFLLSLKGSIDGLQLQMWLLQVENYLKKAPTGTTRILGVPQAKRQSANVAPKAKKQFPDVVPIAKKIFKKAMPIVISLLLLLIASAFVYFHHPFSPKRLVQAPKVNHQLESIIKPDNSPSEIVRDVRSQIAMDIPSPLPQRDSLNDYPIKDKARIMLINASSMYQKGLAAQARKKLIEKGFPSQNILSGSNKDKVSKVYAYYTDQLYIPLIKEILEVLYPKKEKNFFDISPKDRTINGWILNSFHDEQLHILIRMPNME
jgi:tetratricopeptide (TPR) repeat protein